MARNVEIKARVGDLESVRSRAEHLADGPGELLLQEDTFFPCEGARLKLRRFDASAGELIWYSRPDAEGPKESQYALCPTETPDLLCDLLARAYGVRAVVRKRRTLLLVGRTRVHLDQVEGVGEFVELEVVLREGESTEDGVREAQRLMGELGIGEGDLVSGAYMDLLEGGGEEPNRRSR